MHATFRGRHNCVLKQTNYLLEIELLNRREKFIMPKMKKKSDLPFKKCHVCAKPFSWRKKWSKEWDQVVYCSERCRRQKRKFD